MGAFFFAKGPEMTDEDSLIRDILTKIKTIALVGWSPKPDRPSHEVAAYLVSQGYRVIPVNPGHAGQMALGEVIRADLTQIEGGVDMVEIFRRSEEAGAVVDSALAAFPDLIAVWMQLGVGDDAAAARARARGVYAISNRCPAIEIPRLGLGAR